MVYSASTDDVVKSRSHGTTPLLSTVVRKEGLSNHNDGGGMSFSTLLTLVSLRPSSEKVCVVDQQQATLLSSLLPPHLNSQSAHQWVGSAVPLCHECGGQ